MLNRGKVGAIANARALDMLNDLMARFPYQFKDQESIDICVARGWALVFTKFCEDLDAITNDDPRGLHYGFHWTQVKEKFGVARLHWEVSGPRERSNALISAAQRQLSEICIICGTAPANIDHSGGYLLNFCEHHTKQRKVDPEALESPWDLDWV